MSIDICKTYALSFKGGLYVKADGNPIDTRYANIVRSKMEKDGLKVVIMPLNPLDPKKVGIKVHDPSKATEPTPETAVTEAPKKPAEGEEKSIEDLRKEVAELKERRELERELADLKGEDAPTQELSRGNAPSGRPRRKPFKRDVLDLPSTPGFERRWVNDVQDGMRIAGLKEEGWEVDPDQTATLDVDGDVNRPSQFGSATSRHVGVKTDGSAMKAVLMRKRKDWYDEDRAEGQKEEDRKMANLVAPPKGLRGIKGPDGNISPLALQVEGYESEVERRI
jgi:hypothetical protein